MNESLPLGAATMAALGEVTERKIRAGDNGASGFPLFAAEAAGESPGGLTRVVAVDVAKKPSSGFRHISCQLNTAVNT